MAPHGLAQPLLVPKPPPAAQKSNPLPAPPPNSDDSPAEKPEPSEDENSGEVTESSGDELTDADKLSTSPNPLVDPGQDLDRLIEMRINEDLWTSMQGELPCLDIRESCLNQLQGMAAQKNPAVKAIQQRIETIQQKIDEAKANNKKSVTLGIWEPAITSWLKLEDVTEKGKPTGKKRGLINKVLSIFSEPIAGINEILSLIGVPLFRGISGGDANQQQRQIAITDLQVKVAEIERQKGDLVRQIKERVVMEVLEFDTIRRNFQITKEITKRSATRLKILDLEYRFATGSINTPQMLSEINSLDKQKAETFRLWSQLRIQLVKIKIIVTPEDLD